MPLLAFLEIILARRISALTVVSASKLIFSVERMVEERKLGLCERVRCRLFVKVKERGEKKQSGKEQKSEKREGKI